MICKKCQNQAKASGLCKYHYQQEYRKKNALKYAYTNLKSNAKRRGKVFELTFEQFAEFAVQTDYIGKRGKKSESYSIDRKDNNIGYVLSNIRSITLGENSRKGSKTLNAYYDYANKTVIAKVMTSYQNSSNEVDCPF